MNIFAHHNVSYFKDGNATVDPSVDPAGTTVNDPVVVPVNATKAAGAYTRPLLSSTCQGVVLCPISDEL